ncbi:MAG: hypothetical protein E7302_06535 [Butyrivibrio sp.]|nr:hypothetical protein [Butyrivibrio sp.]
MSVISNYLNKYKNDVNFKKKFTLMALGVFFMGFFLSFLINVSLGTDPCTFMNVTISERLHILFGTWQLLLNAVLIVIVIIFSRDQIGPGTIANMVFIGYIADFFRWVWSKTIPEYVFTTWPYRGVVFALALIAFVIAASFYMNADMGVAPYDAMPVIISEKLLKKIPFKFIRMGFDGSIVLIGILFGGRVEIATILMVFLLGPTITTVGGFINRRILGFNN